VKAVDVTGLSYTYPDGTRALRNVDLCIEEGESVALLGPNGAGKSTLLLHLNGVLETSDRVHIDGLPVLRENLPEVRRRVGLVFQDPDDQLFSPTVFDDVAFGPLNLGVPPDDIPKRVDAALEKVGMAGYGGRSPFHLSLGERKRIALATVLSMEPSLLVLDEPTSNVDPRARREIIELLRGMRLTKIIASHDIDMVAELCDRVVVLADGRIVADGPVDEVLADVELLERNGLEPPSSVRVLSMLGIQHPPVVLSPGAAREVRDQFRRGGGSSS